MATFSLFGFACGTTPGKAQRGGEQNDPFDKLGATLDDPGRVFATAGYRPLWTLSANEAGGQLPPGLRVVPQKFRVWEDGFRKHLTNGEQRLSTGDLLRIRWAVAHRVATDPQCQFRPPQRIGDIARSVESARRAALASLHIDRPSSALTQVTRADAACAWVKSQRFYEKSYRIDPALYAIESDTKRHPTADELNARDSGLSCARSNAVMLYLTREIERQERSGLTCGAVSCMRFRQAKRGVFHSVVGVTIALPGGKKACLLYDPTASRGRSIFAASDFGSMRRLGPLDRTTIEAVSNEYCLTIRRDSPYENSKKIQVVTYNYIFGENHPEYAIGNFDASVYKTKYDGYTYDSAKKGSVAFANYWQANTTQISSLDRAIEAAYSGRL